MASDLPPALAAALDALWPPGPADATPEERRALLAGALPGGALLGGLVPARDWGSGFTESHVEATCALVALLRVRASRAPRCRRRCWRSRACAISRPLFFGCS